ncbi:MAG: arylsulfatase [Verrucomicrobiales bacterium]|nr:arylsulfatase [Verrucomicrobiales bacterium]
MKSISALLSLLFAFSAFAAERPNVVVIMVDDLGYSDLGSYGGEIETPNLDALAADGLRFSQFYNTAKCHSSRVSLLTGQYCIAAGDVALSHAVTSAEVLTDAGYFTAMTGKWHLDKEPTDFGFQRYFGHLSGACNFFQGDQTFRLNGEKWEVPPSDFYTTVAKVDFALDFLTEARKTEKPFYLYVAFNAPHAPLHALPEDYAKYKGRYDAGWDIVRDARIQKQKDLGLLPNDLKPSPRPPHVRAWKDIVPWQQDYEINRMVTLAAMIDRVDQEVGRIVEDLRSNGELDNTMILFVSDNGACPYDRKQPLLNVEPTTGDIALADSTGWSWARNAPFRFYKQNQFEGGISSPGIVHWPAGLKTEAGQIVETPVHLIDVLPTLADLAETEIATGHPTRELRPVSGVSLRPIFEGDDFQRKEPIHFQFSSDYALRDGDWKLVSFKGEEWELYNIANDRTELNDLAASEPDRVATMAAKWDDMTVNVLHSERIATSSRPLKPAEFPRKNREWTTYSDSLKPSFPPPRKKSPSGIRARKNTSMTRAPGIMELKFTGDDPGIAMDLRGIRDLPAGPYVLSFKLENAPEGTGEVFYTIDKKTTLPNGLRIEFPVLGTNESNDVRIALSTEKLINQIRLDVSEGPGSATIQNLRLLDSDGKMLKDWTPGKRE